MEFDVSLLAKQIKESHKLSDTDAKTLRNLQINLKNPVLPQHQIESRAGSRPPKQSEIEMFEKIVPIKRGCYNLAEDKKITSNWREFCKLHNWDSEKVHPFLLLREDNHTYIRSKNERQKFVQFLADGIPDRTLYSVYYRFRTLYNRNLQRRFYPEEDKMILEHLENIQPNAKQKYSDLAKVLQRTRAAIWRRYKILKRKQQKEIKLMS